MHPIEHLRYLARTGGDDVGTLASEAAIALGQIAREEPLGLVPACRRLVARHVTAGPVWWLAARLLRAPEPAAEAFVASSELEEDRTPSVLARELPDDTTVLAVGWPEVASAALARRGDLEVLAVDSAGGAGGALAHRLESMGNVAWVVPDRGVGAAAATCGLVLVEAVAAGPSGLLAPPGSHAAAATAAHAGIPVWGVTPVGRVLPDRLWEALLSRFDGTGVEPWDRPVELVPASLLTSVVGPEGVAQVADGLAAATCDVAPELLRDAG